MSFEGRVNSVVSPVLGLGSCCDCFVEGLLEGNPKSAVCFGDLLGGGAALVEFGEPVVFDSSAFEDEGFTNDDDRLGHDLFGLFDEAIETGFVRLDGPFILAVDLVPDVVDADQDAEDGGSEVETVFFPAFLEVGHFVATDSTVVNTKA